MRIKQVELRVGDGSSNRGGLLTSSGQQSHRRVGGVFGRAIQIVDPLDGFVLIELLHQTAVQGFTRQVDGAYRAWYSPHAQQFTDCRGNSIDQGNCLGSWQRGQV